MKQKLFFICKSVNCAHALKLLCTAMAFGCTISLTSDNGKNLKPTTQISADIKRDSINNAINALDLQIQQKDSAITCLFNQIDSIRTNKHKNATDSFNTNRYFAQRDNIKKNIDSLNRVNMRLLRRAQRAAIESPSYITDIPCSERTLYRFFHVDEIKIIQIEYDENKRQIAALRTQLRHIPKNTIIKKDIDHYFDSLSIAETYKRLILVDATLRQKDSIISQKHK